MITSLAKPNKLSFICEQHKHWHIDVGGEIIIRLYYYYHCVDTSAGELFVPDSITRSIAGISIQAWKYGYCFDCNELWYEILKTFWIQHYFSHIQRYDCLSGFGNTLDLFGWSVLNRLYYDFDFHTVCLDLASTNIEETLIVELRI